VASCGAGFEPNGAGSACSACVVANAVTFSAECTVASCGAGFKPNGDSSACSACVVANAVTFSAECTVASCVAGYVTNGDSSACVSPPFMDRAALKTAVDACLALDATSVACCAAGTAGGSQANCANDDTLACGVVRCNEMADWNTALVTDMSALFAVSLSSGLASFNADISAWDVSATTSFQFMFLIAGAFDQDISGWDVSSATNFDWMFAGTGVFNSPLNAWGAKTSSVTSMHAMFYGASFNRDISGWDVSSVTGSGSNFFGGRGFYLMFSGNTIFNQDLSAWDVSKATDLESMFQGATAFNSPLFQGSTTAAVVNMKSMFNGADAFNQDISGWDVSKVTIMYRMFGSATAFNQDISSWGVSSVTSIGSMFRDALAFNQDISSLDVSSVNEMSDMFNDATAFDSPLNAWGTKTSSVTTMARMFYSSTDGNAFNQDISGWDVSSVSSNQNMFFGATWHTETDTPCTGSGSSTATLTWRVC
jgi:surface protein